MIPEYCLDDIGIFNTVFNGQGNNSLLKEYSLKKNEEIFPIEPKLSLIDSYYYWRLNNNINDTLKPLNYIELIEELINNAEKNLNMYKPSNESQIKLCKLEEKCINNAKILIEKYKSLIYSYSCENERIQTFKG